MKLEDLTLDELKQLHQAIANGGRGAHREMLRQQGIGSWSKIDGFQKPLVLSDDDELLDDEPVIELSFSSSTKRRAG